ISRKLSSDGDHAVRPSLAKARIAGKNWHAAKKILSVPGNGGLARWCYNSQPAGRSSPSEVSLMTTPSPQEVTQLLLAWNQGDATALARLTPLVYDELRRLAHRYMGGEHPGHTLQTTALVNEAYLRLVDSSQVR